MKSSTIFALFVGVTPVVAAVILVQLWSSGSVEKQTDRAVVTGSQAEQAPKGSSSLKAYEGQWHANSEDNKTRTKPKEPVASEEASRASSGAAADSETLTSQSGEAAMSGGQAESATTRVTGDVGSLTFERQASPESGLTDIKATKVSVMGENGELLEFSSENGQPVIVTKNLDDGLYKWEAVNQPELNPRVREELSAARESGDLATQLELKRKFQKQGLFPSDVEVAENLQTGSFRIVNGQMVKKDIPEEGTN